MQANRRQAGRGWMAADVLKVKLSHLCCQRGRVGEVGSAGLLSASGLLLQMPEKSQSPSLWTLGAISDTLFIFTVSHKNLNSFHRPFISLSRAERCLRIPRLPGQLLSGRVRLTICSRQADSAACWRLRPLRLHVEL